MQYEVRTMPDGVYVVVAEGKTVTQHNSYTDAQRASDRDWETSVSTNQQ